MKFSKNRQKIHVISSDDRLKKAIERNRKKRQAREAASSSVGLRTRRVLPVRPSSSDFIKGRVSSVVNKSINPKMAIIYKFLYRCGWIFCLFLLLRLVFAGNGIYDFYNMEKTLSLKKELLKESKNRNLLLSSEIKRIRSDSDYQKNLVRDHLGVISRNEFLILFAQDSSVKPKKALY